MIPTILIVDADPAVRLQITLALRRWGYHALEARDECDAMAKLRRETVDLILLAERLPDETGVELDCQLQQAARDKGIPVIVLADANESEARLRRLATQASSCLNKPVLLSDLRLQTHALFQSECARGPS